MQLQKLTLLCAATFLTLEVVSSTIITSTLITGFIGGFLMGKITLGTFLAVMNTLNQRPTTGPAAVTQSPSNKALNRDQAELLDIPDVVETEVRDRFLRHIGKMDPLNCLPRVFCEVSADPKTASQIFGNQALNLLSQNSPLSPNYVKKTQNDQQDDVGEEEEDDENDSDSDSEEDEEIKNLKKYKKKEEDALESKVLDQLINDYDDPLNYYFVLKDKQKEMDPELMELIKDSDFSSRLGTPVSNNNKYSKKKKVETYESRKLPTIMSTTTKSSIDDVFDEDPFFEEFSSSLQRPQMKSTGGGGVVNVGILRRNRRQTIGNKEDDVTMAKYKMAAQIAETKDPKRCQSVFKTCPFSSEEVLKMVTMLDKKEANGKPIYTRPLRKKKPNKSDKDGSLSNLKNTLLAIEKLNDATLHAQFTLGEQVDYQKVVKDVTKDTSNYQVSESSAKIVKDIENIEDKFGSQHQHKDSKKSSKKKLLKTKNKKTKSKRTRRHNDASSIKTRVLPILLSSLRNGNRRSRIENGGSFLFPRDREDEFFHEELKAAFRSSRFSDDDESGEESEETKKIPETSTKKKPKPSVTLSHEDNSDAYVHKKQNDDELEDDEVNSPESEEIVSVPSFSQTFIDTLDSPIKRRPKPKPVHSVVKVKQYVRSTTPKQKVSSTSTTIRPKKPTNVPKLKVKFSGESEDDEEDAINSEKEIDELVSKYKPKQSLH